MAAGTDCRKAADCVSRKCFLSKIQFGWQHAWCFTLLSSCVQFKIARCPGVGEVRHELLCWTCQWWAMFLASCRHLTPLIPLPLDLDIWVPWRNRKLFFVKCRRISQVTHPVRHSTDHYIGELLVLECSFLKFFIPGARYTCFWFGSVVAVFVSCCLSVVLLVLFCVFFFFACFL